VIYDGGGETVRRLLVIFLVRSGEGLD
jgi:hypothetical protein